MSAEPRPIPNWNSLQERVLEGGYEVSNCLSATHTDAIYKLRILGDRFTSALVRVYIPSAIGGDQVQTWQEVGALRHTNLHVPLTAGVLDLDSLLLPYVGCVKPDETLDAILGERALTPDETRQALQSVLDGLAFLHEAGFVHGEITPAQIVAMGDAIQISAIHARRSGAKQAADDVQSLGATLFEMLTRRKFNETAREQVVELPHPFNLIVEQCVRERADQRPSLLEIRRLLNAPKPIPAPVVAAPASKPEPAAVVTAPVAKLEPQAVKPEAKVEPAAEAEPVSKIEPAAKIEPAPHVARAAKIEFESKCEPAALIEPLPRFERRREREPEPASDRLEQPWLSVPIRKWLYIAAAIVAVVLLMWVLHPAHVSAPPKAAVAAPPPAAAFPTHVVQPTTVQKPAPVAKPPAVVPGANWRVVVYTFNREADAEKRVAALRAQHAALQPHIFSPRGSGAPYLIVLGGPTTKDEAERLRRRARAAGLPRDTFIQNYR